MKKKVVLFDFDGTIGDSLKLVVDIYNHHSAEYGMPRIDNKDIARLRKKSYQEIIAEYHIPIYKIPLVIGKLRAEFAGRMHETTVMPHIPDVLKKLKDRGYTLGIVTSNEKKNIDGFLKHNHIEYFDFTHSQLNIFGKAGALKKVLQKYHYDPGSVIYVGDETRDIEACKTTGIDVIAVTYGYNSREALEKKNPTYIVDKPQELLEILT